MTPNEKPPLFTELSPEKAASLNGGYYVTYPCYPSKPWGAAYYPYYRSRSYSSYSTSKAYPAYQSASFKSAATRLDAVLFE
jgi:hypothetical protein